MKIFSVEKYENKKIVKLLGIIIYKRNIFNNQIERKYFHGLFKIKKRQEEEKYYILGIKIYTKKNEYLKFMKYMETLDNNIKRINFRLNETNTLIQSAILVANQHSKVFPQFKDKHKGEVGVIVATAPSMLKYKPIENAIHIGVNRSFLNKRIKLDYWFSMDLGAIKQCLSELKNTGFTKFFGQIVQPYPYKYYYPWQVHISDSIIAEFPNSYKYYIYHENFTNINIDIEKQLLPDNGSCVFQAVMFALYIGIKKLYIVGCDAACTGYFDGREQSNNSCVRNLPNFWANMKKYIDAFYPDVEVISVNPVNLKGLFKDVYTDENGDIIEQEQITADLL